MTGPAMTKPLTPTPNQEPGVGGPIDLAGIEAYRKFRTLAVALLLAVTIAVIIISMTGSLDRPGGFPLRVAPTFRGLAVQAFAWAAFALTVEAGNRTETRLACLGALWAIVVGLLCVLGSAALLELWAPGLPFWLGVTLSSLAGLAAVLSLILPWAVLTHRRYKRLLQTSTVQE